MDVLLKDLAELDMQEKHFDQLGYVQELLASSLVIMKLAAS